MRDLAGAPPSPELASIARGVRTLARVMDDYYLDPILGFVLPGIGDVIGSLIGVYIVIVAVRRGLSPVLIARMLINLALDAAIGALPILGDLADVAFKANDLNVALLVDAPRDRRHARDARATGRCSAARSRRALSWRSCSVAGYAWAAYRGRSLAGSGSATRRAGPGAGNFAHSSRTSPAIVACSAASAGAATARAIHAAICFISGAPIPRDVTDAVPSRMPLGSNGLRLSNGTEL